MLDQKDFEIIKNMMETVVTKSESLILDEIERTRNILDNRIDKVQKNLDELSKRVEELEKRTA